MMPRSPTRGSRALAAAALASLLLAAGCSGETAGNVTSSNPDVPLSPTVGEGPDAAYSVLSCHDIGQEATALAAIAASAPTAEPADGTLQGRRAALQALAKTKGCNSQTGRLTEAP